MMWFKGILKKRGISRIITAMLLVLLALALIGVIWLFFMGGVDMLKKLTGLNFAK